MNTNILWLSKVGKYTLKCTKDFVDDEVSKFVSNIYYTKDHYSFAEEFNDVFNTIRKEDELFKNNSVVTTVYDENNDIQGTVRRIYLSENVVLPIEREFDIDLVKVIKENLPINNICEAARFANKNNDIRALKLLISELIGGGDKNDLILASLDSVVLKGLRKLGLNWYDIGEPKKYLGSITCPVALKVSSVKGRFSYENSCKTIDIEHKEII